jgi:hypothetical protein
MDHFAGLDVSVKETSVCIVDDTGKIVREVKVASEPKALLAVLKNPAYRFKRIGLIPTHPAPVARKAVPRHHPRWEPGALTAPAGICAGGGEQSLSLPRPFGSRLHRKRSNHTLPGAAVHVPMINNGESGCGARTCHSREQRQRLAHDRRGRPPSDRYHSAVLYMMAGPLQKGVNP